MFQCIKNHCIKLEHINKLPQYLSGSEFNLHVNVMHLICYIAVIVSSANACPFGLFNWVASDNSDGHNAQETETQILTESKKLWGNEGVWLLHPKAKMLLISH